VSKVLVVVPVRGDSSRVPGKPLRWLWDRFLVEHVVKGVRDAIGRMQGAVEMVVATDSPLIREVVEGLCAVRMTSTACRNGTERVAEVLRQLDFEGVQDSVVVNVQGDQLFVTAAMIAGAVRRVVVCKDDVGTMVAPLMPAMLSNPNRVKTLMLEDGGKCLDFYRLRERGTVQSGDGMLTGVHIGIYAYRPATLRRWAGLPTDHREAEWGLEQLRPLGAGMRIGAGWLATKDAPVTVDSMLDLEEVRKMQRTGRWKQLWEKPALAQS